MSRGPGSLYCNLGMFSSLAAILLPGARPRPVLTDPRRPYPVQGQAALRLRFPCHLLPPLLGCPQVGWGCL